MWAQCCVGNFALVESVLKRESGISVASVLAQSVRPQAEDEDDDLEEEDGQEHVEEEEVVGESKHTAEAPMHVEPTEEKPDAPAEPDEGWVTVTKKGKGGRKGR
jgi:hypothetical protein